MACSLRAIFMALELWARWRGVAVKEILVELKALHATKNAEENVRFDVFGTFFVFSSNCS